MQGTCNQFHMLTFHRLYNSPFENFVNVEAVLPSSDVGFVLDIVCATSCPVKAQCSTCRRLKAMAEPTFQHSALQEYVVDANDVMRFKLVRQEKDLDNESLEFAPEMCHQVTLEMRNCL